MNPTIPDFYPPGTFTAPGNPCVTCQYHFEVTVEHWPHLVEHGPSSSLHLCLRLGLRRHPVSGHVLTPDSQRQCDTQRMTTTAPLEPHIHCGPEGRYWQPKAPSPAPRP